MPKISVFALFTMILLMGMTPMIATVKAQTTASVTVFASLGGTTVPESGTYTYNDGQIVTFTATSYPDSGFFLSYWLLTNNTGTSAPSDNPLSITMVGGQTYTLQPVFLPVNVGQTQAIPSPSSSTEAVVIVLSAVGGTTSPGPGTYTLVNAAALDLTATAANGFKFDHWVIGGYPLSHGGYSFTDTPTDNPYNVNHGYGYTYSYQPVFSLVSSTSSSPSASPTVPEYSTAITIAVTAALAIVLVAAGTYAYKRKQ